MLQIVPDLPKEYAAYLQMKPELLAQYPEGTYLAFLDGVVVGASEDLSSLLFAMRALYPGRDLMIQQLFVEEYILTS